MENEYNNAEIFAKIKEIYGKSDVLQQVVSSDFLEKLEKQNLNALKRYLLLFAELSAREQNFSPEEKESVTKSLNEYFEAKLKIIKEFTQKVSNQVKDNEKKKDEKKLESLLQELL